jgi:hypothetical protein
MYVSGLPRQVEGLQVPAHHVIWRAASDSHPAGPPIFQGQIFLQKNFFTLSEVFLPLFHKPQIRLKPVEIIII